MKSNITTTVSRLATGHMDNIGDFIGEASQATNTLKNFGR